MQFNKGASTIMHVDLNSCFATIEQQANPFLRNRPIAVAAYDSPGGCILAPSIEAKTYGIKTGMRVHEGRQLCPSLIILKPDPNKYRQVHLELREIFANYTDHFYPKSIDDFYLDLTGYPAIKKGVHNMGREIKARIKNEVGEWLTVSIGFGPSRFIAKTASNFKKPDGLFEINEDNFLQVYERLKLPDLHGINTRYAARLNSMGIYSVVDFYEAPLWRLRAAFASIAGYYWFVRLRGWQIDNVEFARRSFGNSYALPYSTGSKTELLLILQKLVEKTGSRLRRGGYKTNGVHLSLSFKNGQFWHKSKKLKKTIFDSREIFREMVRILGQCPINNTPVRVLAESCFSLVKQSSLQLEIFEDVQKKERLVNSLDTINDTWGDFTIMPAAQLALKNEIHDRISFGGIRELG